MFKIVGGVILGFIATLTFTVLTLSGVFFTLGSDRTFQAGSFEATPLWLIAHLVVGFIAALIGGKVCAIIATKRGPVMALAVLMLILGLASAFSVPENRPTVRAGDVTLNEAIVNAREPSWLVFLLPLISAAGVLVGGRIRKP